MKIADVQATRRAFIFLLLIVGCTSRESAALVVMKRAANEADWTVSSSIAQSVPAPFTLSHENLRQLFIDDRFGGYCGLQAEFAAQALRKAGFDAFAIHVGTSDRHLTQVTTILRHGDKFYLYDPTFAATLEHSGRMVDLFEALDGAPFSVVQHSTSGRDWLASVEDIAEYRTRGYALQDCEAIDPIVERPSVKCHIGRYDIAAYARTVRPALAGASLPTHETLLVELIRRGLFGVGIVRKAKTREAFIKKWREAGLPEHKI